MFLEEDLPTKGLGPRSWSLNLNAFKIGPGALATIALIDNDLLNRPIHNITTNEPAVGYRESVSMQITGPVPTAVMFRQYSPDGIAFYAMPFTLFGLLPTTINTYVFPAMQYLRYQVLNLGGANPIWLNGVLTLRAA